MATRKFKVTHVCTRLSAGWRWSGLCLPIATATVSGWACSRLLLIGGETEAHTGEVAVGGLTADRRQCRDSDRGHTSLETAALEFFSWQGFLSSPHSGPQFPQPTKMRLAGVGGWVRPRGWPAGCPQLIEVRGDSLRARKPSVGVAGSSLTGGACTHRQTACHCWGTRVCRGRIYGYA